MFVELLARDTGLDAAIQILGVDLQHPVHAHHVDGNATLDGLHLAFQGRAGAEGNDRDTGGRAQLDDFRDFFRRFGETDGGGRFGRMPALVLAVGVTDCLGDADALPQKRLKVVVE